VHFVGSYYIDISTYEFITYLFIAVKFKFFRKRTIYICGIWLTKNHFAADLFYYSYPTVFNATVTLLNCT